MLNMVTKAIYREALKGDVGHQITCPECGKILDARESVSVSDSNGPGIHVSCVYCWGKMPMLGKFGSLMVLDGRLLWERKSRKHSTNKGK